MKGRDTLEVNKKTIHEILENFLPEQRFSLAILQAVQKEYNYISSDNLKAISDYLSVPISQIFSMATFYKSLSLTEKGKFILKICDGTACHIRGSVSVLEEIKRTLGIEDGETTPDGLFSIEVVNCVGSCAMAPVVICDQEYFGNVGLGQGTEIIEAYRATASERAQKEVE
jgi:NADH-quinone oxidoreductase subunit E